MRDGNPPPDERARASFETNESEEIIPPDRPRVWPETPRPPRPQVKRPLDDWLNDFTERIKQHDARARERSHRDRVERHRRPRGLARIIPIPITSEKQRPEAEARAGPLERRGRRRTKVASAPTRGDRQPAQPEPHRDRRRRRGRRPHVVRPESPPPTNTPRTQPELRDGGGGQRRSRRRGRRRRPRGPSQYPSGPSPSS